MSELPGDNRPPAYYEGEELILRCSAFGGCIWELIASAQGYTPGGVPASIEKAYEEGRKAEPHIIKHLQDDGWVIKDRQKEGHLRVAPNMLIRYHPDGIGTNPYHGTDEYVIEAKALSNDNYKRAVRHSVGQLFSEYPWQLSAMMLAEGKPGVWVALNKETGQVHYEPVLTPPIPMQAFITRALAIAEGLDDDVTDRPCDDPKHFPCRYLHLRPEPESTGEDILDVTLMPDDFIEEFNQAAREYIMAKGQIDELEKRREVAKAKLMEMGQHFTKMRSDKFYVPVKTGRSGARPNIPKMVEDGLNPDDYIIEGTEYRYVQPKGIE